MPRRSADPPRKAASTAGFSPVAAGLTTPLQHMLSVVNDPAAAPARRDKMAIAAAPYCHPRIADKGKKAVEAETAQRAGEGSAWEDDLAGWEQ